MKIRFLILSALALTSLQGAAFALDLKLKSADGDELVIRKTAIEFIQKANGKLRIGTLVGNFEITPITVESESTLIPGQPAIDGLQALNSAVNELLELEEPRDHGEVLKEFNDLKTAEQSDLTRYLMFRLALFRGDNDTLQCATIEQL